MANNTTRNITYPTSGDSISPLETVFATLASTTDAAMGNLAAADIKTGTLAIARGGTGAGTAEAALIALNGVSAEGYNVAGKNKILNSDFSIWQRIGTTTSTSSAGYFADRWRYVVAGGASKVFTQSRQAFTPGNQPEAGYEGKYFYRVAVTTAGSGYTSEYIEQPIEDVRTFAGKKVVVSFWAKASTGTMAVTPRLVQYFGTGGTPSANVISSFTVQSVGIGWTRFTATLTTSEGKVPNLAGKTIGSNDDSYLALQFVMPNNTIQTLDIWGVQLEEGVTASRFSINGSSQAEELASCQRYYYRIWNSTTSGIGPFAAGVAPNTTSIWGIFNHPTAMRANPSFNLSSSTHFIARAAADITGTIAAGETTTTLFRLTLSSPSTAPTAGQGVVFRFGNASTPPATNTAWFELSAEL